MKNSNMIAVLFLTLFLSCGGGGTEDKNTNLVKENPKALEDGSLEIKSYRSRTDLVEELYAELVSKSAELKKLEDDLESLPTKENEAKEPFFNYNNKSKSYYNSAEYKLSGINDSTLKKSMSSLIKSSQERYAGRLTELNSLLEQLQKNNMTLNDHHIALKILTTLELMEKFQGDNLPDRKPFKDLINEQQNMLRQMDSLTPKR